MILRTYCIVLFTFFVSVPSLANDIESLAKQYFKVYAERENFSDFMNFYDDAVVLEDIVYGNHIANKLELTKFFNWDDPKFQLIEKENLVVSSLVVDGQMVVATGYFNSFKYDEKVMGPWRFSIHLIFNHQGKIIRQIDWINYMPREHFLGGQNMNDPLVK